MVSGKENNDAWESLCFMMIHRLPTSQPSGVSRIFLARSFVSFPSQESFQGMVFSTWLGRYIIDKLIRGIDLTSGWFAINICHGLYWMG